MPRSNAATIRQPASEPDVSRLTVRVQQLETDIDDAVAPAIRRLTAKVEELTRRLDEAVGAQGEARPAAEQQVPR